VTGDVEGCDPGASVRRRRIVAALAAAVALAVGAAALWWRSSGSSDAVTSAVTAAAGAPLLDGFEVAEGSVLVGPVVVDGVDANGAPRSWFAVLAVEGDPAEVWVAYATQLDRYSPYHGAEPTEAPGCMTQDPYPGDNVCRLGSGDADLAMRNVPGDVEDGYVVELVVGRYPAADDETEPGDGDGVPDPAFGRPSPAPGGPLAPETVAYEGDEQRYIVVEGTELVRQHGAGSVTGGFSVLLRVDEDADLERATQAYVEQATQFEGEPPDEPEVTEHDGTAVARHDPPGGAGGYSGTIWSVDRPAGEPDWIFYDLFND